MIGQLRVLLLDMAPDIIISVSILTLNQDILVTFDFFLILKGIHDITGVCIHLPVILLFW